MTGKQEDGFSQGGFIIVGGKTDKMLPMCWSSKITDWLTVH